MRRLNLRFTLGLLGLAAALIGGVFLTHHLQSGRIARALLAQARSAEDQGRAAVAIKYLSRYLEFVPADVEERARLGRLLAAKDVAKTPKAVGRAVLVLEQVLARDPDRREERRLLVRLALDARDRERAGEHLKILGRSAEPDAEAEALRGRYHEMLGQYPEAVAAYRKAVGYAPDRVDSYVGLAALLRRHPAKGLEQQQVEEADRLMDELVAKNADSFRACLARWRYRKEYSDLKTREKREQAAGDVGRAETLAPDEIDVLVAVAELAQLSGDMKGARAALDRGAGLHKEAVALYRAGAAVEMAAGERKRAIEWLEDALKNLPEAEHFEFQWSLVHLLSEAEDAKSSTKDPQRASETDLASAEQIVARLRQGTVTASAADYLQGRILVARARWSEAARLLERAYPELEATPKVATQIDALLTRCYAELGDPARQATVCERLVKRDPSSAPYRLALAGAEAALGRIDSALDHYREALNLPDAPADGRVQFARLLIQHVRQVGGAGDWDEVDQVLRAAEQAKPDMVEVPLLRAEALTARNKYEDAEHVLDAACRQDAAYEKPRLRLALALLIDRRGDAARARQIFEEVERKKGDFADLRVARALTLARLPAPEAVPALTRLGQGVEGLKADDQARVLTALAEAQTAAGGFREAEALWARLARLPGSDHDVRLRLVQCELATRNGNEAGLTQALEDLRRIEGGDGPGWCFAEAMRQAARARAGQGGDLAKARSLLDQAAARRPGWSALALGRAEIAEAEGRPEQAIEEYRKAVHAGERGPRVARRLVELLYRQQRYKEADEEVRQLLRQGPAPRGLQALAAEVFLRTQDRDEAARLAARAVPAASTSPRDQLWLGVVLAVSGKDEEAERHLRKAKDLGENDPDTWVTLIEFLASRERFAEAEKLLGEARGKLPADKAPLALAPIHEALGRREEAEAHYRTALQARPDDVAVLRGVASFYLRTLRPQAAEPLLRRVAEKKVRASDEDAAWARLGLATALASRGDLAGFEEAMPLVGLAYDADGRVVEKAGSDDDIERRRARARVLATRPSRTLRTMAIALLEDLGNRQGLGDGDRYLLSQLREATDDLPKAVEQLRQLVATRGREPMYLVRLAQMLLRQSKAFEARQVVERLEEMEKGRQLKPGTFGTVDLRARLLEAAGDGDKAVVLLRDHVARADRPEEFLLLVQSLNRQKRYKEAAELCERAWQGRCPAEIVAGTHVGVLQAGRLTGEPFARAERLLGEALGQKKDSAALLLAMAGLKGLAGHFEEEETLYRQVLAVDARNVVALNNLAWLLSQRGGNGAEALPLIERAIKAFGPTPDLLDTRALVHLSLKQGERARADLETSLADTPSAARYFHLARVHQLAGNAEAATAALEKARSLGLKRGQLHPVEQVACARLLEGVEER